MSHPTPSLKVHCLVEYMKSAGFWLETDEVRDMGPGPILEKLYGIEVIMTADESGLLQEEMLILAEANEIREAGRKMNEIMPEDKGDVFFRQGSKDPKERATCYTMPYSYPVDQNLRGINPFRTSFPSRKEAPPGGKNTTEVSLMKLKQQLKTKEEEQMDAAFKKWREEEEEKERLRDWVREIQLKEEPDLIQKTVEQEDDHCDGPWDLADQYYESWRDQRSPDQRRQDRAEVGA